MFNFNNNTIYILYDELIFIPPLLKEHNRHNAESHIGEGFTVNADGNSYILMSISSDFAISTTLKFSGSVLYRGVFMND